MENEILEHWISTELSKYERLTSIARTLIENLLRNRNIEFLAVIGRTKKSSSIAEKVKRKNYSDVSKQMTDVSGIRVITYFESQVSAASACIEESFEVDKANSLDKDKMLSVDQIGYRSVHYVCSLGSRRCDLPEYKEIAEHKFEIQVRTVLQHAWAELAHDRKYKFSGKLPRKLERELYLYSGMLEIADKGFNSLANEIDEYSQHVSTSAEKGYLDINIDSISLEAFAKSWANSNQVHFEEYHDKSQINDLVDELKCFGINSLDQLNEIIPKEYAGAMNHYDISSNVFGLVRDWMLLNDHKRYRKHCWKNGWHGLGDPDEGDYRTLELFERVAGTKKAVEINKIFGYSWMQNWSGSKKQ